VSWTSRSPLSGEKWSCCLWRKGGGVAVVSLLLLLRAQWWCVSAAAPAKKRQKPHARPPSPSSCPHRHPDVELSPPRLRQLVRRLLDRPHVVVERRVQRERDRPQDVGQVAALRGTDVRGPAVRLVLAGAFSQVESDGACGHRDDQLGVFQAGGARDVLGLLHGGGCVVGEEGPAAATAGRERSLSCTSRSQGPPARGVTQVHAVALARARSNKAAWTGGSVSACARTGARFRT
jgi:hypothetical protein